MELVSTAPASQPSNGAQTTPPYFFSTDGGRKAPRFLGVDRPPPIARSDVAVDTADMISQLRTKWPRICYSIFTDPTIPTGFDPRWFWDEMDDYVLGRQFLFNVICTIIKENEEELSRYIREWNSANAQCFENFPYILNQGIDFVFNSEDRNLRGDEFLKRALHLMREAYDRACLDAEAQAISQPVSRVTSNPDALHLSRISTAEDSRASSIPTTSKRWQRSTPNVARSISTSAPVPHMTPSMRARGPMGTLNAQVVPPQYYYQGPNPQFPQDRSWMPSPNMGHVFQGQVPTPPPYGQYPIAGPNQFFPQYHGTPPPPMQLHPSNIARIPTQELINNMPAFSFGSGTLPFPHLPILPPPQDSITPPMGLHPSQIPATSFQFQHPMSSNLAPRMQHDTQPMSIPEGQSWTDGDENTNRPSDGSERGRRYSTTRGRGRGNFNIRGRRSSSSHDNQASIIQWNNNNGPSPKPLRLTSPPSQPVGAVDTMSKRPSNATTNRNLSRQPQENGKISRNGSTAVLGNGPVTHSIDTAIPSSAPRLSQDLRSPEHQRGWKMPFQATNAGPAPKSKNGNIDTSRAIGPHSIGENVEDLSQLFVSGLLGYTEAETKAIFDSYVAIKDVRLTSSKTNAFVQFHSTADVRRLLQQTNEGRLYVGPIDNRWCLYVETPRNRQHEELASLQAPRARPQNTSVSRQSLEQNNDISVTSSSVASSALTNSLNRDSPTKKGKKKAANVQHKPIYTPQDARSQFPPQEQTHSSSKPSNVPSSQGQPLPKLSTWATIASSKQHELEPILKVESAEQVDTGIDLPDQKQSSPPSEIDILRQVQNQQMQTSDKTIGQPQRPTSAAPQPKQSSVNVEASSSFPPSETAQHPTLPSTQVGQRKSSKPIIPALPLRSPTNSKSISRSDESGLAGPKSTSPMKSTSSENENISVGAQVTNEDSIPPKDVAKDSSKDGKIHTPVEQPSCSTKRNNESKTVQTGAEHMEAVQSSGCAAVTKSNVDNDQLSQRRPNAKKSKGKKKKKKAPNAPLNSESRVSAVQSDFQNDANQKITDTEPSRSDTQASSEEDPSMQHHLDQHEQEEPSTNNFKEPQKSIDELDRSPKVADLDCGWRLQYDEVMQHLTKVQPALQDEITKETLGFKQEIVDVEEKILAGDKEMNRTANQKKTWGRKRKRLFDEYKALIEERLPMLAGKVQASAQPNTPSIQTTSPSSSALSVQSENTIIQRAQSCMKELLRQIPSKEQIATGRGEDGSTWVAVPVSALDNAECSGGANPSASHNDDEGPGESQMERLIKGEQTEQSPLPSISQTMASGKGVDPASSDTETAGQITEQIDGLGISGISVPTCTERDETESDLTEETMSDSVQNGERSPQRRGSSGKETQGTLRGGEAWQEADPTPHQEKPKGPRVVSPSRQSAVLSYASVAKIMPKHVGPAPLPGFSDPTWNTKAKVIDGDASSIGSSGPTPASGASTMSRRTSNATKGKDKIGGDDWAVKHGEKVWGDQGFQQD